ncbi:class I SAM-dependent methyltransferase [Gaetbulibacter aquiaggeris]|uniref:Class I SAM-dependent methyltransferase n=1 Tax=Gaetbulibacter aquiaggeris TaxID=1735373 RepID=A0ABW7MQC1_9FLAO
MLKTEIFDKYVEDYEAWYDKYPEVYESELAAIREQFLKLPENIRGIEVGIGTGRFAQPLGIKEGIEPSEEMARKAVNRKIEVLKGVAEYLPYRDLQFDFVLFVTICHLDNVKLAVEEAHRVLKHNGSIIIGFLDKDQAVAKEYKERRDRSTFFSNARFYSVMRIKQIIEEAGFKNLEFNQTLFGNMESIKDIQLPKSGYGEGSFVVLKATKK